MIFDTATTGIGGAGTTASVVGSTVSGSTFATVTATATTGTGCLKCADTINGAAVNISNLCPGSVFFQKQMAACLCSFPSGCTNGGTPASPCYTYCKGGFVNFDQTCMVCANNPQNGCLMQVQACEQDKSVP